jgi:hypothetical protein
MRATMRFSEVLTPKAVLVYGGALLLLLGLAGFAGVASVENTTFYFDQVENWAHLVVGLIALAVVFVPGISTALRPYLGRFASLLGIVALFFAVYGFYVGPNPPPNVVGVSNLESPIDDLLNLALAAWALVAAWRPRSVEMSG